MTIPFNSLRLSEEFDTSEKKRWSEHLYLATSREDIREPRTFIVFKSSTMAWPSTWNVKNSIACSLCLRLHRLYSDSSNSPKISETTCQFFKKTWLSYLCHSSESLSQQFTNVTEGREWSYSILPSQSRSKTYFFDKFKLLQNGPKTGILFSHDLNNSLVRNTL